MSSARRAALSPVMTWRNKPGLGLEGLPHIGVERAFGDVAVDRHFLVLVALAEDAAVALLDLGRLPRGVEVMQGDQAFLDVGAGAHLLGAADQHAHRTLPTFSKRACFLASDSASPMAAICSRGMPCGDQLLDDLLVGRVTPCGRIDAHVGEDHLRAACRCGPVPDGGDVFDQPVDLRFREVGCRGRQHPCVGGELASVGGDVQGVIYPRVHLLRPQPLVAFDQFLLEGVLLLGHRAGDDDGLAALQARTRQVEHLGRLHVGEGPEHLLEFRQVGEAGEAASRPQARAVRGDFHGVDDFAEGGRPGVEMLQPPAPQSLGVEESLHRVHLDHRVGNRRAGGERHAMAGMLLVEVTGFHVHVEGPLAAAGLDAGDALHLGRRLQVLEIMGLVDEDVIDAEFVEHQPVILLVLGEQVLQPFASGGLLLLDGLDEVAVGTLVARVFAEQLVVFGDLLQEELLLVVP